MKNIFINIHPEYLVWSLQSATCVTFRYNLKKSQRISESGVRLSLNPSVHELNLSRKSEQPEFIFSSCSGLGLGSDPRRPARQQRAETLEEAVRARSRSPCRSRAAGMCRMCSAWFNMQGFEPTPTWEPECGDPKNPNRTRNWFWWNQRLSCFTSSWGEHEAAQGEES